MAGKRRTNAKGRSVGTGRYFALFFELVTSPAFRSLSGPACKYYCELASRYDGKNNGYLHLSLDKSARILRIGKASAKRAQQELIDKGLIVRMKDGNWYHHQATEFAFTHLAVESKVGGAVIRQPTRDYRDWQPPEIAAEKKRSLGSEVDRSRF